MLSWIPLAGPILQGLFSTFSSITSSVMSVKVAQIKADVTTSQISEQIIKDTNDDILLHILRDAAILPVVVWSALIGWDTIIGDRDRYGNLFHPWASRWMWHVGTYPDVVGYLPYVVLVFLFGNIGLNIWRSR